MGIPKRISKVAPRSKSVRPQGHTNTPSPNPPSCESSTLRNNNHIGPSTMPISKRQCHKSHKASSTSTTPAPTPPTPLNGEKVALCMSMQDSNDFQHEVKGKEAAGRGQRSLPSRQGKYKCEKCLNKFGSYKEVVAHRASQHKKKGKDDEDDDDDDDDDEDDKDDEDYIGECRRSRGGVQAANKKKKKKKVMFKCPVCPAAYQSEWMVGVHKSMFHSSSTPSAEEEEDKTTASSSRSVKNIDLNLPPPEDDE